MATPPQPPVGRRSTDLVGTPGHAGRAPGQPHALHAAGHARHLVHRHRAGDEPQQGARSPSTCTAPTRTTLRPAPSTCSPFSRKPVDLGSWIHFAQPLVTIPAGKSVAVPFTVAIPATATPGDHAGGVVVSLTTKSAQAGRQPGLARRRPGLPARPRRPAAEPRGQRDIGALPRGRCAARPRLGHDVVHGEQSRQHPPAEPREDHHQERVRPDARRQFTPPDLPELLPGRQRDVHAPRSSTSSRTAR